MRIAVFSRSTIDHFQSGGMETQLNTLLMGLSDNGCDITVITTSLNFQSKVFRRHGVKYIFIGETTPGLRPLVLWEKFFSVMGVLNRGVRREGKLNYFNESARVFHELHKKKPFDLVLSQSTAAQGITNSRFTNREGCDVPVVSIIHGTIKAEIRNRLKSNKTIRNWLRFFLLDLPLWYTELYTSNRKFFNQVDYVIAVSDALKRQFFEDHGERTGIGVIYNGVDENKFSPGNVKFKIFTVLYVGRVVREKGIDRIVEAVSQLNNEGCDCMAIIIGGGIPKHVQEFKNLAKKLNVANKVDFTGPMPNEKLVPYYQKSHVFALPSRREEGHPMTLSEALCSGLPVLASNMGGISDVIIEGKNGFTFDERDNDKLIAYLRSLYKDPKKLERLSIFARKDAVNRFSKSAMVREYEKIFNELIKKN